jgi:hypothetical protein
MKTVLQHIFHLKRAYAQLPFFEFLRDESLSVRHRLAFFPCMASFIMSFGDLNRYVLRVEPSNDPHQQMINAHSYEDDHHWPWYLEDFVKLGHDTHTTPAQVLRFIFSDDCKRNRLLSHELAHLIWGATPQVRLAVIEAIEETGNVLFALTAPLATRYTQATGVELRYLGDFHFKLESGHAMNNDHAELAAMSMDEIGRADAIQRCTRVFELFQGWVEELHAYALRNGPPGHAAAAANEALAA